MSEPFVVPGTTVTIEVLDPGDGPGENERAVLERQGVCFRRVPQGWLSNGDHDWHPVGDLNTWYCSRCRRVERRTLTLPPPFPEFARTVDQDDRIEPVLGRCPHGVDLDSEFCSEGCRV